MWPDVTVMAAWWLASHLIQGCDFEDAQSRPCHRHPFSQQRHLHGLTSPDTATLHGGVKYNATPLP